MAITAMEMFHLTEAHKNGGIQYRIKEIGESISEAAKRGYFCTLHTFARGYSSVAEIKNHFIKLGFEVTEEADKDGDPRLVFSWQNPKDVAEATN